MKFTFDPRTVKKEKEAEEAIALYIKTNGAAISTRTLEQQVAIDSKSLKKLIKKGAPQEIINRKERIIAYRNKFGF